MCRVPSAQAPQALFVFTRFMMIRARIHSRRRRFHRWAAKSHEVHPSCPHSSTALMTLNVGSAFIHGDYSSTSLFSMLSVDAEVRKWMGFIHLEGLTLCLFFFWQELMSVLLSNVESRLCSFNPRSLSLLLTSLARLPGWKEGQYKHISRLVTARSAQTIDSFDLADVVNLVVSR